MSTFTGLFLPEQETCKNGTTAEIYCCCTIATHVTFWGKSELIVDVIQDSKNNLSLKKKFLFFVGRSIRDQ